MFFHPILVKVLVDLPLFLLVLKHAADELITTFCTNTQTISIRVSDFFTDAEGLSRFHLMQNDISKIFYHVAICRFSYVITLNSIIFS